MAVAFTSRLGSRAPLFLLLLISSSTWASEIEEHEGHRGFWLRTESAEAFVATEPKFRVLSFARPGERSLMADRNEIEQGLRLAFMEPDQVKPSFDVGNQPAEVLERTATTARVRLLPAAGLRYGVTLSLASDRPQLKLDYRLENVGEKPRRVACWSVSGFPTSGTIVAPFGQKARARRQLVLSWWTRWPQPNVRFGRDALAADTTAAIDGNAMKVGVITDAGWAAFLRGSRGWVTSTTFDGTADYPEDGANISFFQAGDPEGRTRCEVEQMGPLTQLDPGQAAALVETLELIEIPELSKESTPDDLRQIVERQLGKP